MIEAKLCPDCGATLPGDALEGLCPRCLLRDSLRSSRETPVRTSGWSTPGSQSHPPAPEPSELAPHFPQLEILELLGQGGMGAVYKARQLKLDRLVALKVLSAEAGRDAAFAERFMREARALARLNHPHIVTIHDFGEAGGLFYFLMEFVDGPNLRDLLRAGPMDLARTLAIIPQICDALQYAHDEDVVHRDVKPENILLDKKGRVKIADFGLAKLMGMTPTYLTLTGSHQVMGTLYYMAPEQMERSHTVDHRADIYSLGVVCYEMLTGELPLGRFAPPSHKADIPEALDVVILRALAKEPERRYQEVTELKHDVAALASAPRAAAVAGTAGGNAAPAGFLSVAFAMKAKVDGETTNVQGVVRLEGDGLVLEYQMDGVAGAALGTPIQEKRIAFHDIASIGVECGNKTRLVLSVSRLSILTGIPSNEGKIRLAISEHDRRRAKQMAEFAMRKKFDRFTGRSGLALSGSDVSPQHFYLDLVRMDAKGPAAGLLATAIVAGIAWALFLSLVPAGRYPRGPVRGMNGLMEYGGYYTRALGEDYPGLIPIFLVPISFLIVGAWRMRNLRSYEFAMAASILALVPWSPAFPLGIVMGIWGIVFLTRPEVKAAFAHTLNPANQILPHVPPLAAPSEVPRPRKRLLGKMRSFFHSVGNYCFNSMIRPRGSALELPEVLEGKAGSSGHRESGKIAREEKG